MRVIKTPFGFLNLDRISTIEVNEYKNEELHPTWTHKIVVDGKTVFFYLEGEEEKERFMDAVFRAYRDDVCIELDADCREIVLINGKRTKFIDENEELWS